MKPKTIVAIEIGSYKIKGAVGTVAPDGRVTVLAVEESPSNDNVRYGRVQNIRGVSATVNDIITRLEAAPTVAPQQINSLVLAVGGRSLGGVTRSASLKFPHECEITDKQVQRLAYEASHDILGEKNVVDTLPRSFYVNNTIVKKRNPVGIYGESLRGEFVIVTCGKETVQNLERLKFDNIEHKYYAVRATAVADLVLTSDEKQLGTAIVDFGDETSTVAVYKDGCLAFLCTIPMGSRLITLDLTYGLGTTEEAAENIKRELAADPDNADPLARSYAHSRAGEIAANVLNQLELAGFGATAISKLVITGGGAKLADIGTQLGAQAKLPVRVADMPADVIFRMPGRNNPDNIDIVALLATGARRVPETCLIDVETEPEEEDEPIVIMEEPEVIPEVQPTVVVEEKVEEHYGPRPVEQEEKDEDLFKDQPDNEDEEQKPKKRFSLFGKKKPAQPKEEPIHYEPEPEVDVPDEDPAPTATDDHYESTKKGINKLRDSFMKLFTPPEYDDENGYE